MRFTTLRDILFPKSCAVCKKYGDYLCTKCKNNLVAYPEVCTLCDKYSENYRICPTCKKERRFSISHIFVTFRYDSNIKKLILDLKYRHRYDVVNFFAEKLKLMIDMYLYNTIDSRTTLIIGIPSHWKRKYFIKGYNQSEILAQSVSALTKIPYSPIVKKHRNTKSQVKLNKSQRQKNLKDSFVIRKKYHNILQNTTSIVIIDDITTTGSSLNMVAKTLKKHYPHLNCYGLVIAKR